MIHEAYKEKNIYKEESKKNTHKPVHKSGDII